MEFRKTVVLLFLLFTAVYGYSSTKASKPNVLGISIEDEVRIKKDIRFGKSKNFKGEKEILTLDIYSPAGDFQKNRAAIL